MGATILIAEDSRINQYMLKHIMAKHGFTTVVANDGAEALAQIEATAFDLLLTDINMPNMDGFELIGAIRSQETDIRLPIIVLTATGDDANQSRATELGADAFVTQPFNSADLIAQVEALIADGRGN